MKGGEGRGAGSECLQWVGSASKRVILMKARINGELCVTVLIKKKN